MKKFLQISVLFVFVLVLASSAFMVKDTKSSMAAVTICPRVVLDTDLHMGRDISPTNCLIFPGKIPPPFTPNVGWNS